MPAMTKVAKGRGPASESLQGRNPRGMNFIGAQAYMAILASGCACPAAAEWAETRIDGAGEWERRAVVGTSHVGEWRSGLGCSVRRQF